MKTIFAALLIVALARLGWVDLALTRIINLIYRDGNCGSSCGGGGGGGCSSGCGGGGGGCSSGGGGGGCGSSCGSMLK